MLMTLVHQPVNSQRLVVNTTCLKLAKSSNQQLRLSCDNPDNYHCLIDGSNTREYEVCRVWKWISKGNSQQDLIFFNHKTVRCLQLLKPIIFRLKIQFTFHFPIIMRENLFFTRKLQRDDNDRLNNGYDGSRHFLLLKF